MSNRVKPSISNKLLDGDTWESLKAAGFSEEELLEAQPEGPLIFSYTRKQAIADGVLMNLMQPPFEKVVQQAGFTLPTAMTMTAFGKTILAGCEHVKTPEGDEGLRFPPGQSPTGRLWDLLVVLHHKIKAEAMKSDRCHFKVAVDARGDGDHETVELWSHVGPGDESEAVMTIMLEGED